MRKNVILINCTKDFLQSIKKLDKNVNVAVCLALSEQVDESLVDLFILRLSTDEQFNTAYKNDYNLSFEEIEKFRATQLKVEHYMRRSSYDFNAISYKYYLALSFWLDYFNKVKIDMVFVGEVEHGEIQDSVVMDVAKSKNIPVYKLGLSSGFDGFCIHHILNYNKREIVNLSKLAHFKPSNFNLKKYLDELRPTKIGFKHPAKYFLKTKIATFLSVLAQFFRSPKSLYKRAKKYPLNRLAKYQIFSSSIYISKLTKLYKQISTTPNLNENFIYYPLHQEPEASFMVRSVLDSQIFIVYLLASTLQEMKSEVKIYIKEHPAQFFVYEKERYFLSNIESYRSFRYYALLLEMPNVVFCDMKMSSKDLIKHSRAVASICGSSLIEAVFYKKPILCFGNNLSFVEKLKECFNISSRKALENALNEILQGFSPKYEDLTCVLNDFTLGFYAKDEKENSQKLANIFLELLRGQC